MPTNAWTHPRHKEAAAAATLCCFVATVLAALDLAVIPWYADRRKGKDIEFYIYQRAVDCQNKRCVRSPKGEIGGWQEVGFVLLLTGFTINCISFIVQAFMFWPVIFLSPKVPNILLEVCQLLDLVGAPFKFACGFLHVHYSSDINKAYAWHAQHGYFQLEPLPIGLVLLSFISEILSFLGLTIALDPGPAGGPTYIEQALRAEEEMLEEKRLVKERRKSSYIPETSHSQVKVTQSQSQKEAQASVAKDGVSTEV